MDSREKDMKSTNKMAVNKVLNTEQLDEVVGGRFS